MAKSRGSVTIVKLLKHHILNCVVHEECVKFRHECPEEFDGGGERLLLLLLLLLLGCFL
jgi:hypothetical protein